MPDSSISQLDPLSGGSLAAVDVLPVVVISGSETKKITAKDLVEYGIALIADGSIPSDKVDGDLPAGSIDTSELADKSVTAAKLADQSSALYTTPLPATGSFIGQIAVDKADDIAYIWNGSAWEALTAVTEVEATGAAPVVLTANIQDNKLSIGSGLAATTNANEFLAGPADAGGAVSYRKIAPVDLPLATSSTPGASTPGSGLVVDSNGTLSVDNTVAPSSTNHVVTYDSSGLVTGGRAITGTDLPTATDSTPGVIRPGTGLVMGSNSTLNHSNNVSSGQGTKFTFDAEGHITGVLQLQASDIPALSFDQITSGEINTDQLAECAVEAPNICDYATVLMQEDNPGPGAYLGQLWFTPSTAQLRVYARGSGPQNIWVPVGFGALQANNLRWGGTIDADLGTIATLTAIGVAEGLTAGDVIPAPTDALGGMYFVTQVAGSSVNQPDVVGDSFTTGDWLLCVNTAQGYIRIEMTGGGGGGGGGANSLNDLIDVEIGSGGGPFSTIPAMSLSDKNIFKYDGGSGMWRNTDLIDGGDY